jgi:hypothetical protein
MNHTREAATANRTSISRLKRSGYDVRRVPMVSDHLATDEELAVHYLSRPKSEAEIHRNAIWSADMTRPVDPTGWGRYDGRFRLSRSNDV